MGVEAAAQQPFSVAVQVSLFSNDPNSCFFHVRSSDSEEEVLRGMLARAGVQLGSGDEPPTLFDSVGACAFGQHLQTRMRRTAPWDAVSHPSMHVHENPDDSSSVPSYS